jgi:hypothetical protein
VQRERLSERVVEILSKYPQWKELVEQARSQPPFKLDYSPAVIEIFDSFGLLAGTAWGESYETKRPKEQPIEFVAWCLDGQLAVFYVGSEIVINRLNLMSAAASVCLSLAED